MAKPGGTLRVYLIADSVRTVVGELETDQDIECKTYQVDGHEVECALCFGDKVVLYKYDHGVVMQYMEGANHHELPAGIDADRISAIVLSGVVLPPEIQSAAYEHRSKLTSAWAVRILTPDHDGPDPSLQLTLNWRFISKSERVEEVYELYSSIASGQLKPSRVDGREYAAGATIQYLKGDEVMEHILEGIYSPTDSGFLS